MPTFTHGEISLEVDEDGFMQEPDGWNKAVAAALATTEGVDNLRKQTGYNLQASYALIPSGPAKGACKVAGLPKPTGCV